MITFTEVAALVVSVSIIVTAFKLRAPGMTLSRIPLFVWAQVVTAFMVLIAIGGLTGVMLGSATLDPQLHDTYFVVAHLHYVLIGGGVFPLFGAFYYWFPKMTGRMLSESGGKWNFWLFFIGFNLTFFPMHVLGLDGMTRRIYTYGVDTGWEPLNLLATAGALLIGTSVLVFIGNVFVSLRRGVMASPNPWEASTLEWSTPSPPPSYNFLRIPVVTSRDPLWDEPEARTIVTGVPTDIRAVLVTRLHDAEPDCLKRFPSPSIWPLLTAIGTTIMFIGSIFTPWAVIWGSIPIAITMTGWFWPTREETAKECRHEVKPSDPGAIAALIPAEARS